MNDIMHKALIITYTWPETGRKEVRYRRVAGSPEAQKLIDEVDKLKAQYGDECPYSYEVRDED